MKSRKPRAADIRDEGALPPASSAIPFAVGPKRNALNVIPGAILTELAKGGEDHVLGLLRNMVAMTLARNKVSTVDVDLNAEAEGILKKVKEVLGGG